MIRTSLLALAAIAMLFACATAPVPAVDAPAPDDCGVVRAQDENVTSPELEACAVRGIASAEARLGMLYWGESASSYRGSRGIAETLTVPELQAEGRRLIESAARNGNSEAQNELGLAYLDGEYGMETNLDEALRWLRAATDGGDSIAPYNLARMYFSGRGVMQSAAEGETHLRLSARRGYKPGRCSLARWLDQHSDRASRAEASALRYAATRDDYGYGCAAHDIMEEMPLIETALTL